VNGASTADAATPAGASTGALAARPAVGAAQQNLEVRALIDQLHAMRLQPAAARDWNRFAELVRQLCRARAAIFVCWDPQPRVLGMTEAAAQWQPAQEAAFADMLQRAQASGHAFGPSASAQGRAYLLVVVRVTGMGDSMLVLQLDEQHRPMANELVLRAMLAADVSQAQSGRAPVQAGLADMVDLSAEVMAQNDFAAAALALANGVTVKLDIVYAALGWVEGPEVRTVAISQLDRFDRKSQQVLQVERIFDDARMQDAPLWAGGAGDAGPPAAPSAAPTLVDGDGQVLLDEAAPTDSALALFAAERGNPWTCALPMRDARGRLCAVLLCVFAPTVRDKPDAESLMLALDLVQPRLADQHWQSQGVLLRGRAWLRESAGRLLGPEHVWAKLIGLAVVLVLAYVCLGTWQHRVDANAQLVTDATRLVSAQFDGRVDKINVTAGDLVKQDAVLLELDVREQRQQEAELQAEIRRTEAEVAKFRAAEQLSEMEIAQARLEQSQARLARVAQYIAQAVATAPFDGVVVEGERKDLLGAPVKKGEMLLRVAKVEGLYATLMVPERDIREIAADARGELLLLSHPGTAIPFQITSIIPVAQVKGQEGNHFVVTARLVREPEPWWRPGMTGLAKIEVGERRIVWILTHKLVDNIRLFFWW
jgi:uncharacterized small protein (DUF1192 family)